MPIKRLLTATVTLGLAVCSATVALEALGVLFRVGFSDPELRVEVFLARIETELGPMQLPSEPLVNLDVAEHERWRWDEEPLVPADAPDAKPEVPAMALGAALPGLLAEPPIAAEAGPALLETTPPEPVAVRRPVEPAAAAPGALARPTKTGTREASRRATVAGGLGCPMLDWLGSYMVSPGAPATRVASRRARLQ